jgi:hypothetical protein
MRTAVALTLLILLSGPAAAQTPAAEGAIPYDAFETPDVCAECHVRFTVQHEQALMSQCFTHYWDEIEYFELAYPHSQKLEKVSGIEAGCNNCHAPLAFLAGDIPPERPSAGTRANEGTSCDLCHSIVGFDGDEPFNGNFVVKPGDAKQGTRGAGESFYHDIEVNEFLGTAEFCGTCHNEKDPYGVWVKSTHFEWRDGPWAERGVLCQDCHMPPAKTELASGGEVYPDARQHLFHGAHTDSKLAGAVDVLLYCDTEEIEAGDRIVIDAMVMNAKAGHMIPSGSVEERVVHLHVEAVDSEGTVYHLPVDRKGFEGEDWTIASSTELAYQDIGDIQGLDDFEGLLRDGDVPEGNRIYRMPYLDPEGRMTIAQWHTASLGPDYRLPPLEAVPESFTWTLPDDIPAGPLTIRAEVFYQRLVSSVAKFLEVPPDSYEREEMGMQTLELAVQ